MNFKELLSEFQYDWAISPALRKKFPKDKFLNKSIVVASEFENSASCLLYSLFTINDLRSLNMKIIFISKDSTTVNSKIQVLLSRNDFKFYSINQIENNLDFDKIDYFVYTGCCNSKIENSTDFFMSRIDFTNRILKLSTLMKVQRFILLSDYRSYGVVEKGKCISEYEKGRVDFSKSKTIEFQLIQTIENLCSVYSVKNKSNYIILRMGIILGADLPLENSIITDLFKAVSKGEEYLIVNSINKYSFVYVSDVLNAIYNAMVKLNDDTIYNVVGKNSTVSTGMLSAMIHDIQPEQCKIKLIRSDYDPCYGVNMNNQKIVANGCKPKVELIEAIDMMLKAEKLDNSTFVYTDMFLGNLKVVQNILLGYLLEVDRICKKHDIKYFLAGGTLLGAIRHNGFIPWDDDADVLMLREDYEKFLEVVQDELPSNIKLQTPELDKEYHNIFAKLRIDNTMFATKWTVKFPEMHNGVFFDIFAHDKTSNSNIGKKIHLQSTLLTRALVFNKWNNRKIKNNSKMQSIVSNTLKKVLTLSASEKLQFKSLKWFKDKNTNFLYDGMGRNIYKGDFPKEYLDEVIYWDFEGYKFPVPKEYDNYLKYLYGDYNELVIASKRKNSHDIVWSDLGEYSNYTKSVKNTELLNQTHTLLHEKLNELKNDEDKIKSDIIDLSKENDLADVLLSVLKENNKE